MEQYNIFLQEIHFSFKFEIFKNEKISRN